MRRRCPSAGRTRGAEDRRADAHLRRAFGDRRLEVGRHAHRQRVDRRAPRRGSRVAASAQRAELRALPRDVGRRLGDAHEAAQPQPRQRGDRRASASASAGAHAALGRLAADVDLRRRPSSGGSSGGRARGEPLGRSSARSTLSHPVEALGGDAPSCCSAAGRSGATRRRRGRASASILASAFLDVVLAERALPEPRGPRARPPAGNVLLTASSAHRRRVAAARRAPRRRCARSTACHAFSYVAHNRMTPAWRPAVSARGLRASSCCSAGSGSRSRLRGIIDGHHRTPGLRGQEQGLRPAPVGGPAADDPRPRRHPAHQPAADGARGRPRHGVRHHERRAAQDVRGEPRVRLQLRGAQPRALPRQRLRPAARRRGGVPDDSLQGALARGAERAEDLRRADQPAARPDPRAPARPARASRRRWRRWSTTSTRTSTATS